jgi:hypothetical protein
MHDLFHHLSFLLIITNSFFLTHLSGIFFFVVYVWYDQPAGISCRGRLESERVKKKKIIDAVKLN